MADTTPKAEVKWDLRLSIGLTLVNLIGGISFWLSFPERFKQHSVQIEDHETRLRALESDRGLLQVINERTKNIQDDVKQLHQDFSFRATSSPYSK